MLLVISLLLSSVLSVSLRGGNIKRYAERNKPVTRQARRPVSLKIYDGNSKGDLTCTHYRHRAIKKAEIVAYNFPNYSLTVHETGIVSINNEMAIYENPSDTIIATNQGVFVESPNSKRKNIPIPPLKKRSQMHLDRDLEWGINLKIHFTSAFRETNIIAYNQEILDSLGLVRFRYRRYHVQVDSRGTVMINDVIQHPGAIDRTKIGKVAIVTTEQDVTIFENGTKVKYIEIPEV